MEYCGNYSSFVFTFAPRTWNFFGIWLAVLGCAALLIDVARLGIFTHKYCSTGKVPETTVESVISKMLPFFLVFEDLPGMFISSYIMSYMSFFPDNDDYMKHYDCSYDEWTP